MAHTMDSPKLRQLSRTQLQSLAKLEVVRAVGKTEDIIRRLIKKHPKGVPVVEQVQFHASSSGAHLSNLRDAAKSSTSPATKRNVLKKARKGAMQATTIPEAIDERHEHVVVKDEPQAGPSSEILPDPSTDAPAVSPQETPVQPSGNDPASPLEQPPVDATAVSVTANAVPPAVPIESHNGQDVGAQSVYSDDPRAEGGPDENMVVDVLRQFTGLVNTVPTIEARIAESQRLLDRTGTILNKITPDLRELCVTREYAEVFLMGKMKEKKELWDGTGNMKKGPRKFRMEWLRSERKAERAKMWQEAKSESDEEVIESLQTTPANSRCGSPKRAREETDEMDDDRRKRSRP